MCYKAHRRQEIVFNGEIGWRGWMVSERGILKGSYGFGSNAWRSPIGLSDKEPNLVYGWEGKLETKHGLYFWADPRKPFDSVWGRCSLYGPGYIIGSRERLLMTAESAVIDEVWLGDYWGKPYAARICRYYDGAFPVFVVDDKGNVIDE